MCVILAFLGVATLIEPQAHEASDVERKCTFVVTRMYAKNGVYLHLFCDNLALSMFINLCCKDTNIHKYVVIIIGKYYMQL